MMDLPENRNEARRQARHLVDRLEMRLEDAGYLCPETLELAETAAVSYELARFYEAQVKRHGALIEGRNGRKRNPASAEACKQRREYRICLGDLRKICRELSPGEDGPSDPLDGLVDF